MHCCFKSVKPGITTLPWIARVYDVDKIAMVFVNSSDLLELFRISKIIVVNSIIVTQQNYQKID